MIRREMFGAVDGDRCSDENFVRTLSRDVECRVCHSDFLVQCAEKLQQAINVHEFILCRSVK